MEKQRVQFDLIPAMCETLDRLVEETGASTRAEIMRRALSLFAALHDEVKEGAKVKLVNKDGESKQLLASSIGLV